MAKRNALQILGDAARCGREAAGLSQEALGERADLHRNEIGALERGGKNISFVNLLRVCAARASRQVTCSPISPSPALRKLPPKRTRSGHREKQALSRLHNR
jgi:transcriptional regulator with XRE-family HTH domain